MPGREPADSGPPERLEDPKRADEIHQLLETHRSGRKLGIVFRRGDETEEDVPERVFAMDADRLVIKKKDGTRVTLSIEREVERVEVVK